MFAVFRTGWTKKEIKQLKLILHSIMDICNQIENIVEDLKLMMEEMQEQEKELNKK